MIEDTKAAAAAPTKSRRTVGQHNGEFVLLDTWTPATEDLDPVHFAYVPLTPNQMQELIDRIQIANKKEALKLTVTIVARQVRTWDARTLGGDIVDCRNPVTIGEGLDNTIVEGICARILDGRSSADAQAALSDFLKP